MKGEMKQMPFIGNKVTVKISEEKEKAIKEKLGKAIELLGKSEQYLMIVHLLKLSFLEKQAVKLMKN